MDSRRHILDGHRRDGKRFIPPFVDLRFHDARWSGDLIPNLVWISLVYHYCQGAMGTAARLVDGLVGAADRTHKAGTCERTYFVFAGEFTALSALEQEQTSAMLSRAGDLALLQGALGPMIASYPECPLRFLFKPEDRLREDFTRLREATESLFYRAERDTVLIQALAVGAVMSTGRLKLFPNSTLARLGELVSDPCSEDYESIAASVRATIITIPEALSDVTRLSSWAGSFWRRGLEIQPCE